MATIQDNHGATLIYADRPENNRANTPAQIYMGQLSPDRGLGITYHPDMSEKDVLEMLDLDWNIEISQYRHGLFGQHCNEDKFCLTRPTDGADMGTVSKEWKDSLIKFEDHVKDFVTFCRENNLPLERVGKLQNVSPTNGELKLTLFAIADLKDSGFSICGDDPNSGKLLIQHPYIYGKGHSVSNIAYRFICANSIVRKVREKVCTIAHNANARERIADTLVAARDNWEAYMAVVNNLAITETSVEEALLLLVKQYSKLQKNVELASLYLDKINNGSLTVSQLEKMIENIDLQDDAKLVNQLWESYRRGAFIGSDLQSSKGTAWGLLNVVTEHYSHTAAQNSNVAVNSIWNGGKQQTTEQFLNSISSFAHEKLKRENKLGQSVIQAVRAW